MEYPTGMTINQDGDIRWMGEASLEPIDITVLCVNAFGQDTLTFKVARNPSYDAVLDPVQYGPFQAALSVLLSGEVTFSESGSILEGTEIPVNIV